MEIAGFGHLGGFQEGRIVLDVRAHEAGARQHIDILLLEQCQASFGRLEPALIIFNLFVEKVTGASTLCAITTDRIFDEHRDQ